MIKKSTELSKTIAHALRHEPEHYGLKLDEKGRVFVHDLLNALRNMRKDWINLSEKDLMEMIASSDKRRFELQNGKICALYGHSLPKKIQKEVAIPPKLLYHGTTPESAKIIQIEGLKPMKRQYVHLSIDKHTAYQVGRRRTNTPVILKVLAAKACSKGIIFYKGNACTWLADYIPIEYITKDTSNTCFSYDK